MESHDIIEINAWRIIGYLKKNYFQALIYASQSNIFRHNLNFSFINNYTLS